VSAWGKLLGHQRNYFRSENTISAHVGDQVIVGLDERALLSSAMIAYGVPLFALMLGAIIGNALASSPLRADLYALSGAVIGLLCGLLWLKAHSAGRGINARYRPVILRPANISESLVFCRQGG
jgi:sigma-E factor negative regulatory protein RseC